MQGPSPPIGSVKDVGTLLSVIKDPIVQMGVAGIALIMIAVTTIFTFATHLSTLERLSLLVFLLLLGGWVMVVVKDTYLKALEIKAKLPPSSIDDGEGGRPAQAAPASGSDSSGSPHGTYSTK